MVNRASRRPPSDIFASPCLDIEPVYAQDAEELTVRGWAPAQPTTHNSLSRQGLVVGHHARYVRIGRAVHSRQMRVVS
ncbi:hypothetical protein [Corynebacterium ulcerans]|uniref:hypothetical protein n=1 Tax=Corynebacterium ulcerans TaxID=65058 RepID=UPI0011AEED4C|nr:hypothetical protein [Corynebacterium ulcerans]